MIRLDCKFLNLNKIRPVDLWESKITNFLGWREVSDF